MRAVVLGLRALSDAILWAGARSSADARRTTPSSSPAGMGQRDSHRANRFGLRRLAERPTEPDQRIARLAARQVLARRRSDVQMVIPGRATSRWREVARGAAEGIAGGLGREGVRYDGEPFVGVVPATASGLASVAALEPARALIFRRQVVERAADIPETR